MVTNQPTPADPPQLGWADRTLLMVIALLLFALGTAVAASQLLTAAAVASATALLAVFAALRTLGRERMLHSVVAEQVRELQGTDVETFAAVNLLTETKDPYRRGHTLRITLISMLIGQELELSAERLDVLRYAATFHDIGHLALPDSIFTADRPLSDEEWQMMRRHPDISASMCAPSPSLRQAIPAIRHHHERIDGTGYPDGLSGHRIPLEARIIAVADTWDAMTSDRPYRAALPAHEVLAELRSVSGTQLDSSVVAAFERVVRRDPWMFQLTCEQLAHAA